MPGSSRQKEPPGFLQPFIPLFRRLKTIFIFFPKNIYNSTQFMVSLL